MKIRTIKVLSTVAMGVCGVALCGFDYTTKIGHPFSTVCFFAGIGLMLLAVVLFFVFATAHTPD